MSAALHTYLTGGSAGGWDMGRRRAAAARILAPVQDYGDQGDVCRAIVAGVNNQSVHGTRRSGKTDVIMRILAALMMLRERFVVRMLTNVLSSPTANILERKSDGGLLRILADLGLTRPACKVGRAGSSVVSVVFEWGSALYIHDIGNAAAIDKKHGFTASIYWIDEATKTPLLELALRNLVNPTLGDHGGIKILSYTPDEELDGMAAQLARAPTAHWDRHHLRQWRNPHFGATFGERWARIVHRTAAQSHLEYGLSDADIETMHGLSEAECDAISLGTEPDRLKAWVKQLDPELLRNIFGRWVRFGARYVYPFHKISPVELYFCAMGPLSSIDGTLPVGATMAERVALLPKHAPELPRPREWQVSLAVDLGTVDAWAGVALVWSRTHPQVFELETRKATGLDDDEMFERLAEMITDIQALDGVELTTVKGDLSGMRKATEMSWDKRIKRRFPPLRNVGIQAAKKREKAPRVKQHWLDMMQRRLRFIAGGILDHEGRHLRYKAYAPKKTGKPRKPGESSKPGEIDKHRDVREPGGKVTQPGDHGCDAMLYAFDPIPILDCAELDIQRETLPGYFQQGMH